MWEMLKELAKRQVLVHMTTGETVSGTLEKMWPDGILVTQPHLPENERRPALIFKDKIIAITLTD